MVILLSNHAEMNEHFIERRFTTSKNCDICFIRYDTILTLFDIINTILGFPIFLSICYNACGFLLSVLYIWNSPNGVNLITIRILISSFILFTEVAFAASSVNEVDKKAKRSNIRVLQAVSYKDRCQINEKIVGVSQMCYSAPFALTGWDIFEFTKGFYVTSVGYFATYTLLIINL